MHQRVIQWVEVGTLQFPITIKCTSLEGFLRLQRSLMIYFNMTMERAHSLLLNPMEMASMDIIQDLTRQIISMLLIRTYHTMIVVHQTKEQERQTKVQAKRIAIQICHPRKYPLKQIRTRINLVRKRNKRD